MTESVGSQLKKARLERRLTLEQVAQNTHIRLHYLQALENDQFDQLPSETQGRGFLRLYAGYLGISPAPLLETWSGAIKPQQPSTTPESSPIEDNQTGDIPTSKQVFLSIGHELKERRKALGLELSDVEHYIHIRAHHLIALEEANIEELPSLIQARGMLNNYASFLNLNVNEIMLKFSEAMQSRRLELAIQSPNQPKVQGRSFSARAATPWRRFITPDLIFGGGVIIALLIFSLWSVSRVSELRKQAEKSLSTPLNVSTKLDSPDLSINTTASPTTLQATGVLIPTSPQKMNETTKTESTQAFSGTDPLQVYIIARQRAWMKVLSDGKEMFLGRIIPGNAYPFSGKQFIQIQSGNAAALQVVFNQQDLGSLGITGQSVDLIFTSGGIITPTARFTATPTTTQPATLTPQPTPTVSTPTVTPLVP